MLNSFFHYGFKNQEVNIPINVGDVLRDLGDGMRHSFNLLER